MFDLFTIYDLFVYNLLTNGQNVNRWNQMILDLPCSEG